MNETNKPEVLQRLDRLERESWRWKVLGCTAFAVLGLVVLVGATGSKGTKVAEEIRAKKFVLVDKAGKTRAEWLTGDHGIYRSALNFYNKDGIGILNLFGKQDSALISMGFEDYLLNLGVSESGASILFRDSSLTRILNLSLSEKGPRILKTP